MATFEKKIHTYSQRDVSAISESLCRMRMLILSGNAHPQLARDIASYLGLPLTKVLVGQFSDGEIMVELMESVRGKDVFIIQPTCAPTNDNLMELLILVDAVRRSSAKRITAVIPYFGYSRQDRRPRSARVPISARVVANMITVAGIDRVLMVDLHSEQIQGFFNLPVDNVYASPILLSDIWKHEYPNLMVVSPDVGGVVRARALAKQLEVELAIIDKRRPRPNQAKIMHIIGDVKNRTCVLVDDLVDTAGTLCEAARALKQNGAERVIAYCTHPVLSGLAIHNIEQSMLDELVVTDTIPLHKEAFNCKKIRQLSVAEILAETIYRINTEESVSSIFVE
ncbi:ribose-phosphate pyrophosphokinase (Phosphoribosyl pyrophosphate synthetase) [Candidatus Nitrosacidococcus tergens]|uniref:Ribose-phosphate pyrophosphokinase n=2 Tax=Candidatus Nitrosacidococcus tergens TaxID=553981 RepID=A0A7G1QCT1_9GAMM|nr:ribose-phosphate pyrophosphokinase (Phosphoribosyl pyrophosphate synthetase) [Candidatus Nitrosacidococcus tergens]